MTVLYVLRYWPTLSETFVYREIAAVQAAGVHVEVVALGERADGALADELPDVRVHRVPRGIRAASLFAGVPSLLGDRPTASFARRHLGAKAALRAAWVGRLARTIRADRIHAHFAGEAGETARIAAALAGVPYSVTGHGVDLFRPRPATATVLAGARPAVAPSAHHARVIAALSGARAEVVPCGVDPLRYAAARTNEEGPLRVIAVARNVPKKGLDQLVRAVNDARVDVCLRLVSDAPELAGPRVTVGALPPSAIPGALADAQVFALPCRIAEDGDQDGLPVALLEAMAAGLPVIHTPVGGIPEIADDTVGWRVPVDDPDALRAAIEAAASSPGERTRRGEAARARLHASDFVSERAAARLIDAWRRAEPR